MTLSRLPSSQLLSPEPQPSPGRPPTGTLLVAEVRRTARARLMGVAIRRELPALGDWFAQNPSPSPPSVGSGRGGAKLHSAGHPPGAFTTPPSRCTRPPHLPRPPVSSATSIFASSPNQKSLTLDQPTTSFPPGSSTGPQDSPPSSTYRTPRNSCSPSQSHHTLAAGHLLTAADFVTPHDNLFPTERELRSPQPTNRVLTVLYSSGMFRTPTDLAQASLPKNIKADEDTCSNASSELEVTPTRTPRGSSRAESLLYARDSPLPMSIRASAPRLDQEPVLDAPEVVMLPGQGEMPASFANLLSLHAALERALLLHLATEGAGVPITVTAAAPPKKAGLPSRVARLKTPEPEEYRPQSDGADADEGTKTFRLENVVSWPVVRPIVERGSGKRFGERELAQLLWLWQYESEEQEETRRGADPIRPRDHGGMGFVVSRVRAVEGGNASQRRLRYTYGFGIEIYARENRALPSYSLQSPGKTTPPARQAKSRPPDGMTLIAMWSSQADERKAELARRLRARWLGSSGQAGGPDGYPNASVPLAELPSLDASSERAGPPASLRRAMPASPSSPGKRHRPSSPRLAHDTVFMSAPDHRAAKRAKKGGPVGDHSPAQEHALCSSPTRGLAQVAGVDPGGTSTQGRALSLMERIKAKESAKKQAGLGSQSQDGGRGGNTPAGSGTNSTLRSAELRKKSMLSRLPEVIESIYMIFVPDFMPPSPSSSIPNPPTRRKPAMVIDDLAGLIAKSSRISLSDGEAVDLIRLLMGLCPEFLICRRIGLEDWVMVPSETDLRQKEIISNTKEIVRKALLLAN